MILIIGLGNPGKKFDKTRHNIGFTIVNEFQKRSKEFHFSNFKFKKKFQAEISEGWLNDEKIILVKPQTFMNLSGKGVNSLITYYFKVKDKAFNLQQLKKMWVIHDDIDLPLGKIKIAIGRGSAGHKGVQSIINELKTKSFTRFRIGIKPVVQNLKPQRINEFVLQEFNGKEREIIKGVVKKTCQAIELALKENLEKSMNKYNG